MNDNTVYNCDEYNVVVSELPCPHCGSNDHEGSFKVEG